MAAIANTRDAILQAAGTRFIATPVPTSWTIATTNILDGAVTAPKTTLPAIDNVTGALTANSVTAYNISVTNLAAISANLGTITAGDITGSANISVAGYVKASGTFLTGVTYSGNYGKAAGEFVTTGNAASASVWDVGVWGQVNGTSTAAGKIGVIGIADQANGFGTIGASAAGTGVYAMSSGGKALEVAGTMFITSSSLVTNLNANFVGGVDITGLVRNNQVDLQYSTDGGSTWNTIRFKP